MPIITGKSVSNDAQKPILRVEAIVVDAQDTEVTLQRRLFLTVVPADRPEMDTRIERKFPYQLQSSLHCPSQWAHNTEH